MTRMNLKKSTNAVSFVSCMAVVPTTYIGTFVLHVHRKRENLSSAHANLYELYGHGGARLAPQSCLDVLRERMLAQTRRGDERHNGSKKRSLGTGTRVDVDQTDGFRQQRTERRVLSLKALHLLLEIFHALLSIFR